MSTILMAILIIAFTIILPWIFIARHKKALKKQAHENFHRFSTYGSQQNLAFSRQEIVQNKIIGIDGIKQVLMIAELDNDYNITCIPVKQLVQCRVDKTYQTIGDPVADKEKILKDIKLAFHFRDNSAPVEVLFYNHDTDSIYLMTDMEVKAKEWQSAVSKLMPGSRG